MLSALKSTAADDCGDCGIVIAGGRAVLTAAAVIFLIGKRLRRELILICKLWSHLTILTAEISSGEHRLISGAYLRIILNCLSISAQTDILSIAKGLLSQ